MKNKKHKHPEANHSNHLFNEPGFVNRELSWLSFNERVLQEAEDITVPLIERLKFLGIFSNNRDEFFRVRVAALKRMAAFGKKASEVTYGDPKAILNLIQQKVILQQNRFDHAYTTIVKDMEKKNIFIINETQVSDAQASFVRSFFHRKVRPTLVPIMIGSTPGFPHLKDKLSNLVVKLLKKSGKGFKTQYALIEVPTNVLSRFVVLPSEGEKQFVILLDDIIRFCLDDIFSIFGFTDFEAYTIKITRDADLDLEDDFSKTIYEKISKSLSKRKKGLPVRFVYDSQIPPPMLLMLMKKMGLTSDDNLIPGGRYHNFKDFIGFPDLGIPELKNSKLIPLPHPDFNTGKSLFGIIKQKDVMISYPYHSFDHLIDLIREAAIDPKVTAIKITLYRVAKNSNIINSLINAIRNGKSVTVVVELQARFDEEANIYWAKKLQEEGARVIFGVPGFKVHCKLFLITRKEKNQFVNYARIGTGNFNEETATIYTDHSLFSSDTRITDEVEKVFHFFENNLKPGHYKHLMVTPFDMREKLVKLISSEIKNAGNGKPAEIMIKVNNLVDYEVIKLLYEASKAGVKIRLIIRGMCSIVPGIPGLSENIEAIGIIDRFLEHSRVFIFSNHGKPLYFISSADLMSRNLDGRIEVATPVFDSNIQKTLQELFDLQWSDNTKARIIAEGLTNQYKERKAHEPPVRSQSTIYNYFSNRATLSPKLK